MDHRPYGLEKKHDVDLFPHEMQKRGVGMFANEKTCCGIADDDHEHDCEKNPPAPEAGQIAVIKGNKKKIEGEGKQPYIREQITGIMAEENRVGNRADKPVIR
jgi:hypothetical protein